MLYLIEAITVLAAIPLTIWLKRQADRAWAEHRRQQRRAQFHEAVVRITVNVDNFTKAMRQMSVAVEEAGRNLQRAMTAMTAAAPTLPEPPPLTRRPFGGYTQPHEGGHP